MFNTNRRFTGGAQLFSQEKTCIAPTGRVLSGAVTVTTNSLAGALTYTAAMLLGGLILRDPNGGARSDVLPTFALLKAALPGLKPGTAFEFTIRNTADASEVITVTAGTGGTVSGTATIAQNASKKFLLVVTSTSTYTAYSLGSVTT